MSGPNDPTLLSGADTELHAEEAYCSACNKSFPAGTTICPNDGARLIKLAAQHDDLIGRVLDERYEIRAPLGKGGMGTVYRGWQLSVDREVAIKVIHPKLSNDRSAVKRFLRESRLASRLSQPNIVNVYDFGQSEGVLYIAMELLRGHTLSAELGHGRRLVPKRTITIGLQLCDALEAAHAQGIVHRDLKPGNIVILDDPPGRDLIKVLDFGLAKSLVQDSGSLVTHSDALLGTPLYMAPEQIDGRDSDQRADLYSLGCILYEMLTGRPPFVDTAVSAVLSRHLHDAHAALPTHIPERVRALIDGLLVKDPAARVPSAGDARKFLEAARDAPNLGTAATEQVAAIADLPDTNPEVSPALAETHDATTPVGVAVSVTPPTPAPTPGGAKPKRYAIVAFFAVIPLGVLAFVLMSSKSATPTQPNTVSGSADTTKPVLNQAPADASVAVEVPDAMAVIAVDAGVAPAVKPPKRHDRPKSTVTAPVQKPDAGVAAPPAEPDLPFYPTKKN